MKSITTKHDSSQPVADTAVYLFDDWFDPPASILSEVGEPTTARLSRRFDQ